MNTKKQPKEPSTVQVAGVQSVVSNAPRRGRKPKKLPLKPAPSNVKVAGNVVPQIPSVAQTGGKKRKVVEQKGDSCKWYCWLILAPLPIATSQTLQHQLHTEQEQADDDSDKDEFEEDNSDSGMDDDKKKKQR